MARPKSNPKLGKSKTDHGESLATAIEDAKIRAQALSLQRQISLRRVNAENPPAPLGPILQDWFKQHIAKPGKLLGDITENWIALVPPQLCQHTRLVSLTRGVLHVIASNAVVAAELNIHLRQGLLAKLQNASKGAVYRVKITISSQL